jgi:hypothetical protein
MSDRIAALAAELAKPDYAGMNSSAAAAAIQAATVPVAQPITADAIRRLWTKRQVLAKAWVVANDPAQPFPARVACKAAYDAITGGTYRDFDLSDPTQAAEVAFFFAALEQAGPPDGRVLTAEVKAETVALAAATRPLAATLGFPEGVSYTDVDLARAT